MSGRARMADALLRSAGGRTVLLHVPAPAIPGDLGEQIGLAVPLFQDVELGPASLRKVRAKTGTASSERVAEYELLLSASSVERAVGSLAYESADLLFAQACGVILDGVLLEITSATSAEAAGEAYLYRLGLRGRAADLI